LTSDEELGSGETTNRATFRFDLSLLGALHPRIRADDWRSPLVRRLLNCCNYAEEDSVIEVSFRPPERGARASTLVLFWSGLRADFEKCIRTYQESVLTEFAALGLAGIVVRHQAKLEITEVTRRGERADYWLGDRELMIEVSGQQQGNLESLFEEKSAQLLSNPFCRRGYVFVVNFGQAESRLWFCGEPGGP
jgi:hypothetical protein